MSGMSAALVSANATQPVSTWLDPNGSAVAAWTGLAAITMPVLMHLTAPYGRHARDGWGPQLKSRTGWMLMEAPASLAMVAAIPRPGTSAVSAALWTAWQAHYINRSFVYPLRQRCPEKPMPATIVASAFCFNLVNGCLNAAAMMTQPHDNDWAKDPRFIVGMALFAAGLVINHQSDSILRNLRKPGEDGYKIPHGGLYKYVSCPNYLGEIMEWTGWALATWSLPGIAFALWTLANLVPRAMSHHTWYQEKFEGYPKERKALIPGIL